jgi:hypothetical protein
VGRDDDAGRERNRFQQLQPQNKSTTDSLEPSRDDDASSSAEHAFVLTLEP